MMGYDDIKAGDKVKIACQAGATLLSKIVTAKEPRWGRPVAPMYWTTQEGLRITPDNFVRVVEP